MEADTSVFHQVAYATNDLDEAVRLYASRFGVADFLRIDVTLDALLRGERRQVTLRIALANVSGVELELIQPVAGDAGLYSDAVAGANGFAIRFHHIAYRLVGARSHWDVLRGRLIDSRDIALDGESGDSVAYLYTDERSTLGHYVEYLWFTPEQFAQAQAAVPSIAL
jgi:hypothetical protein